jgi:hypothetical protein
MRSYLPPVAFLRECFDYDPETGVFCWRWRPDDHFPSLERALNWNSRQAGDPAFVTKSGAKRKYLFSEVVYKGRRLHMQAGRVAYKMLTGEEPLIVDHINGNTADNRGSNLRAADHCSSAWNVHWEKNRNGTPRGAFFDKKSGRWYSRAQQNGQKIRLGYFATAEEAHRAWRAYTEPRRGEFFNPGASRSGVFA